MTETTYFRRIVCRYVREKTPEPYDKTITKAKDIYNMLAEWWDSDQEHFFCLHISQGRLVCIDVLHIGAAHECIVHIPTLLRHALISGATDIILSHNHPGGHAEISIDDMETTKKIKLAAKVLDINVLDHIVFTDQQYVSMNERGII